jgi:hypothetical protein
MKVKCELIEFVKAISPNAYYTLDSVLAAGVEGTLARGVAVKFLTCDAPGIPEEYQAEQPLQYSSDEFFTYYSRYSCYGLIDSDDCIADLVYGKALIGALLYALDIDGPIVGGIEGAKSEICRHLIACSE